MSASGTKDHLTRTAESKRQKLITAATVVCVRDESATVKGLDVKIHNPEFSFKAGQWVDTFIPGMKEMTGFSMCSSPGLLERENILRLAIKSSPQPPATWVHTKCSVGDKLDLRVGGDYFYDPEVIAAPHNLLLVAGGVGINPLMSMLELVDGIPSTSSSCRPDKVHLMFSAKTDDEILFKERINEICKNNPHITAEFFITAEAREERADNSIYSHIKDQHIQAAVTNLKCSRLQCHLCGPSPMIDNIEKMLENNGITKSDIHYEKWW